MAVEPVPLSVTHLKESIYLAREEGNKSINDTSTRIEIVIFLCFCCIIFLNLQTKRRCPIQYGKKTRNPK